jgi:hypothetical protein
MARWKMGRVAIEGLLMLAAALFARAQTAPLAAWAEFTGDGVSLRAIVNGPDCPAANVDGKPLAMTVRQASGVEFPVTTCQAMTPAGAKSASVGGQAIALAPVKLNRIVVIGDTGCRLKGTQIQDCVDSEKWPFPNVTKMAAAKHPDLVVHVGDYYYRESPCPAYRPGCKDSPHGDLWDSWRTDFFDPASPLLAAAPWIFARGNHEQCGRGSAGWFRFLDAGAMPLTCPAAAAPFAVRLDHLNLDVIDSADINDKQLSTDRLAQYLGQISANPVDAHSAKSSDATWVVTHKPLWGYELTTAGQAYLAQNPMLAAGVEMMDKPRGPQLPGIDLLLAGHVHMFAAIDFSGGGGASLRPGQLIVGDSGTALDQADVREGQLAVDGLDAQYFVRDTFGYFVLDRVKSKKKGRPDGWKGTLYGVDDAVLALCQQQGRGIECKAPAR